MKDTKGGAVLEVLVADALEGQGELDVERPSPGVVGGTKRGNGVVGDCTWDSQFFGSRLLGGRVSQ